MGLTINCARCHDHKIDPISQKDYYQLVALVRDVGSYGVRGDQRSFNQIDITPPELKDQYDRLTREIQQLEKEMVEIEQRGIVKMSAEDQRATEGDGRAKVLREKLQQSLDQEDWTSYQAIRQKLKESRKSLEGLPEREASWELPSVFQIRRSPMCYCEGVHKRLAIQWPPIFQALRFVSPTIEL